MTGHQTSDTGARLHQALALGLVGKDTAACELMADTLINSDVHQAYNLCRSIAHAGHTALLILLGEHAPNLSAGDFWMLQPLQPDSDTADPASLFSSRFIVAHCNDDPDAAMALYVALVTSGHETRFQGMSRLFADAVGLLRAAEKHKAAQGQ